MKNFKFEDLDKQKQNLLLQAEKAMNTSYTPYSNFAVGAALLTIDNKIITGSNVENASSSLAICAERAAIARANAIGDRHFKAIAVIARGNDEVAKEIITPCGACRQTLYEFSQISKIDLEIIMSNTAKDKIVIAKISELLPLPYGPKDLGLDIKNY